MGASPFTWSLRAVAACGPANGVGTHGAGAGRRRVPPSAGCFSHRNHTPEASRGDAQIHDGRNCWRAFFARAQWLGALDARRLPGVIDETGHHRGRVVGLRHDEAVVERLAACLLDRLAAEIHRGTSGGGVADA